jgi:hypothetical protein
VMETFDVCFSMLALKQKVFRLLGGFDEGLDGGTWCLRDYLRRAWSLGFRTVATSNAAVFCGEQAIFGSTERRRQQTEMAMAIYRQRWGTEKQYAVYPGNKISPERFSGAIDRFINGARLGDQFHLFLHRRQYLELRRNRRDSLHTALRVIPLSLIMPQRDLARQLNKLKSALPELIVVNGAENTKLSHLKSAISFGEAFPDLMDPAGE